MPSCTRAEPGATHVVDLATLTGAVVVALGDYYAGVMGNDDAFVSDVLAAAAASGDHAWRLPSTTPTSDCSGRRSPT